MDKRHNRKTYAFAVKYADSDDFDIFAYDSEEEMLNAYEKARHSYLINGHEWHEVVPYVFGERSEGKGQN